MDNLTKQIDKNMRSMEKQINDSFIEMEKNILSGFASVDATLRQTDDSMNPCGFRNYLSCGCGNETKQQKKLDCFFFNAGFNEGNLYFRVQSCDYFAHTGYCPCENCNKYICGKDAFGIIKEHVDKVQP